MGQNLFWGPFQFCDSMVQRWLMSISLEERVNERAQGCLDIVML